MKTIFILSSILFFCINLDAQEMKEKQYEEIGKFEKVIFTVITSKSLNHENVEKFLQFHQKLPEMEDKIITINLEEVEYLIKSIKNLKEHISDEVPEIYTEICCESKSGIEVGLYNIGRSKKFWDAYMTIDKTESKYKFIFLPEDIDKLLILLEKAKGMM